MYVWRHIINDITGNTRINYEVWTFSYCRINYKVWTFSYSRVNYYKYERPTVCMSEQDRQEESLAAQYVLDFDTSLLE
jgi:hypothetical protein